MNKSAQIVILVIGVLSILFGALGYFTNSESKATNAGFYIGIALMAILSIFKKRTDKSDSNKNG